MAQLNINGSISDIRTADIAADADIQYTKLALRNEQLFGVDLASLRVWDAFATVLPSDGANDDLGLVGGTWGTAVPTIQAGNVGTSGGAQTRYARFKTQVPGNYVNGQNLSLIIRAGMLTAVCSTSCVVDLEVYRCGRDGLVDTTDLCATAAQSMNSLTFADLPFAITPTTLQAGDELDVRVAITYNDTGTATTRPCISNITRAVHTRG